MVSVSSLGRVNYKLEDENLEIVHGFIGNPKVIREPKGEDEERIYVAVNVYDANGKLVFGEMPIESKAMWAYLRAVHGRKVDETLRKNYTVKVYVDDYSYTRKIDIKRAFVDLFKESNRALKIIIGSNKALKRDSIKAITTRFHQVIPREKVRYFVERALRDLGCELNPPEIVSKPWFEYYTKFCVFAKKDNFFFIANLGSNDTFSSLKFSGVDYDGGCTNIVIYNIYRGEVRILRYGKNRYDIYRRIDEAVKRVLKLHEVYEEMKDEAAKIPLTPSEAESLVMLFARQHGYGLRVVKAILERWEEHEEHTLAGLSAALSYVSSNMPHLFVGRWTAFNLSSDAGRLVTEREKLLKKIKVRA